MKDKFAGPDGGTGAMKKWLITGLVVLALVAAGMSGALAAGVLGFFPEVPISRLHGHVAAGKGCMPR